MDVSTDGENDDDLVRLVLADRELVLAVGEIRPLGVGEGTGDIGTNKRCEARASVGDGAGAGIGCGLSDD